MKKIRLPLTIIMIVVAMFLDGCEGTDQQEVKSTLLNSIESPIVSQIKSLNTPEGILLGDLIEVGMGSCTYELYDPAEDGNTYVTISGNITYNGIPVVAKLQYKQINDSEYEFYTLVYNDLPRTELEVNEFFQYLYDSYNEQNKVEETNSTVSATEEIETSETVTTNSNSTGTAIVDDLGLMTSFVEMDSMVYEFGTKAQFDADFNGDSINDTLEFYFEQFWFNFTYIDGSSRTGYNSEVRLPRLIVDDNGDLMSGFDLVISIADLDQNGDFEFLLSGTDYAGTAAMCVYDEINGSMTYIGEIEGQFEFVILNDGEILAPIGTQGVGSSYIYQEGTLSENH